MALSNSIGQYSDCEAIFKAAIERGGLSFTPAMAPARWRQRAYYYRKLLRDQTLRLGMSGATPYDELIIKLEGPNVRIEVGYPLPAFLTLDDGTQIPVARATSAPTHQLSAKMRDDIAEAQDFADTLLSGSEAEIERAIKTLSKDIR